MDKDITSKGWKEKIVLSSLSSQGRGGNFKPIHLTAAPTILSRTNSLVTQDQLSVLNSMFEWPGHAADQNPLKKEYLLNENQQQQFVMGRQHYLTQCAGCHGTNGAGMKRFAPTLINSEWVLGDEKRL